MRNSPPKWIEAMLRLFLRPDIFLTVSGDLLEQYRDSILPARGRFRAGRWYVTQVLGFALRKTLPWAALFAAVYVARFALDTLVPATDFHTRSQVTTFSSMGILLAAGFLMSWRSGSFLAGAAAGFTTIVVASLISIVGNAIVLAFWHDAQSLSAIRASGGLDEAFFLPLFLVLPGAVLGGIGGLAGAGAKRFS